MTPCNPTPPRPAADLNADAAQARTEVHPMANVLDASAWNARYLDADTPWETDRADRNLKRAIAERNWRPPARIVEIGCGSGANACWLARQGFAVTAFDWASTAVDTAISRAASLETAVDFRVGSFPDPDEPRFDLAFDRGCFHTQDGAAARAAFADRVAGCLTANGCWLTLCGSTDGPDRDHGPPRLSAADLVTAIEPRFEILSLQEGIHDADLPSPARIWIAVARVRSDG